MNKQEREAFLAYSHLPKFKRQVAQALEVIQEAMALGDAYVSVSWGKDSTVLLHLCQRIKPDILAVFCSTEQKQWLDNFDEVTQKYTESFGLNYLEVMLTPRNWQRGATIAEILSPYVSESNCFLGLRTDESKNRRISISRHGQIHQYQKTGIYRFCPISNWAWDDVWAYIVSNNLPYLNQYSQTAKNSPKGRTSVFMGAEPTVDYMVEAHAIACLNSPEFARWQFHNKDLVPLVHAFLPVRDGLAHIEPNGDVDQILSIAKQFDVTLIDHNFAWFDQLKTLNASRIEEARDKLPYVSLVKWDWYLLLTGKSSDAESYSVSWRSCKRGQLLTRDFPVRDL